MKLSKVIANNIRIYREKAGLTQKELAERLSISPAAMSNYESSGRGVNDEMKEKIAKVLNISIAELFGATSSSSAIKIPVLGEVKAGIPIEAIQEILDYEEIPSELAATGEFFGLRIKGNSMEPRIYEGDVVIVRKQSTIENGDTAVVLVNGDEATVKKVKIQETGITLIANNIAAYEPHFYTNNEIKNLPIQIIGKVVELRGKNRF